MVEKLGQYVKPFSPDTRALRTDRQTDGETDGQNSYINIARQCARVSVLTRDKNKSPC